ADPAPDRRAEIGRAPRSGKGRIEGRLISVAFFRPSLQLPKKVRRLEAVSLGRLYSLCLLAALKRLCGLVPEEQYEKNERDRNADKPKQDTSTHHNLLPAVLTLLINPCGAGG